MYKSKQKLYIHIKIYYILLNIYYMEIIYYVVLYCTYEPLNKITRCLCYPNEVLISVLTGNKNFE